MSAHESLGADEISDCCPFCGSDLLDRMVIAKLMHRAYETLEKLVSAERGSDEFESLMAEVKRFIGG